MIWTGGFAETTSNLMLKAGYLGLFDVRLKKGIGRPRPGQNASELYKLHDT
jgi:hypothetical protein